jgi:hypothetical protein
VGTPGFDGCELLTPMNRLLAFFFVEVGLCIGTMAASPDVDILVQSRRTRRVGAVGRGSAVTRPGPAGSPTRSPRSTPARRRATPDPDLQPTPLHAQAGVPLQASRMTSQHRYHTDSIDGRCAMRGSCGSKGMFGKPLPCPYNGPAYEVSCHSIPSLSLTHLS